MLDWINANGSFLALLTFLLGLLFGHRFALGREKRKEWNDAVERMRIPLLKALNHPAHIGLDAGTVDALRQVAEAMLPKRGLIRRIDLHLARHREISRDYQRDDAGGIVYTDCQNAAMKTEIESLLKLLRRS